MASLHDNRRVSLAEFNLAAIFADLAASTAKSTGWSPTRCG
jgi:hypothetical protein